MIRFALDGDIPALVALAHRFHQGSAYKDLLALDGEALGASLKTFIDSGSVPIFVNDEEGGISGVIGGVVGPHFLNGTVAASELFWWVDPEARGTGLRLLRAYEDEAAMLGGKMSSMICPHGNERVAKLYERLGYKPVETVFVKAL